MAAVQFDHVDVIFGNRPQEAVALLDQGASKDEVFAKIGHVVGVQDASFEVGRGEIFVLMGLSGSGKSSLLRCVNGLNQVTRGRVLIDDGGTEVDIADCPPDVLRRLRMNRISMVFQHFALMPWRTIRDNVAFGLEIRGVPKAQRHRRAQEVLEMVALGQWLHKHPHELSGGMQQRVGLARAFATEAEILLMDEPFSALDPLIREHLQEELLEFQHKLQRTILFVSHDLDEALKIGTHIAIMEGGRIIQIGRPEEIITQPATEYVRRFVANVNPLNVLRGVSLMRPVAGLPRKDGEIMLEEASGLTCRLDEEGRPADYRLAGAPLQATAWSSEIDLAVLADASVVTGDTETTMRTAIEVRHTTGKAMPLLDESGRLVGAIGASELLAGMLRRPEGPETQEAQPAPAASAAVPEETPAQAPVPNA
jgi:glycine betaine/proline transport system ATP-binding protein